MIKERIFTLLSRQLAHEATTAELHELKELILQHPEVEIPIELTKEYWQLPNEEDADFLEATFLLHSQRLSARGFNLKPNKEEATSIDFFEKEKKKSYSKVLWMGVVALIIGVIITFAYSSPNKAANDSSLAKSEVSTKNGSRSKIQLPDGTSVWLNSDSKLEYSNENFSKEVREVTLIGEAYFDVVKNPAKPFIIHTAKMDIKVLGTAFNVKCYPGDKTTETSLIRGKIEVSLKGREEKIIMKPSEKLVFVNTDLSIEKSISSSNKQQQPKAESASFAIKHLTLFPKDSSVVETGWVENRLIFSEENLEEIAIKMERWYGMKINIESEPLKKELLTGIFEKETIYQALNALQFTTPFKYTVNKDIITITKK